MSTYITSFSALQIVTFTLFISIFIGVIFAVWDLYNKRQLLKFSRKLNGYKFYPIIGNGYHLLGGNLLTVVQNVVKKYGLPCDIWASHVYHYVTADASEVQVILNNPNTFNKNALYDNLHWLFENSLLVANFETWKINRKLFTKSFNLQVLNSYVEMLNEKSCILVKVLKEGQTTNKFDIFVKYTLDSFCATNLQLDINTQINSDNEFTEICNRLQDVVGKRMFSSHYYPEFIWVYSPEGRKCIRDLSRIKKIIYEIIQKKREDFKQNIEYRDNVEKLPLMDMMLEAEGTKFTDEDIFREIMLFMLAASDTSGATLAFLFTLLGMNPEIQEKVYQEIKLQTGLIDPISYTDLIKLKYTEMAIYEGMRLLPVTPLLGRRATADVDLGSRILPSGANILISVLDLHRSEIHWTNPLEYNPDRFLPDEVAKRHPHCFVPFSGGPRDCIGKTYAMMLMKIGVAHVLRNYTVSSNYKSVEDIQLESSITMRSVHELDCQFIARTH